MNDEFIKKIDEFIAKFHKITDEMANNPPNMVELAKEYAKLNKTHPQILAYRQFINQWQDAKELSQDASLDEEMQELARLEFLDLNSQLDAKTLDIQMALLPEDERDDKSVILEIRAGTGGEEASLFGAVLLRMYEKYAEFMGWRFEILSLSLTDIEGVGNATIAIKGDKAFGRLKFEAGVHRVQRVPVTEGSGRIHTSAATVAVLPEAEEVDITIRDEDLRVDTYRAQGAGGQHINTTDSAVRITHIPTGVVVTCQDEKSQHKNRARAMRILRSRIYEAEQEKLHQTRAEDRKLMVGSGDRSERIRTYNFPQGRVSDHRINFTLYKLQQVIEGGALDEVICELLKHDKLTRLQALQ